MPVIPPGQMAFGIHPLLHNRPLARAADDERMQIKLEAIGDSVVVDLRRQSAGTGERFPVETGIRGEAAELIWRAARMTAATSTDEQAEVAEASVKASLQRSHDGCG